MRNWSAKPLLHRKEWQRLFASLPEVPLTFSEKVRFRMAFDRRDMLQQFADKFHVRQYVEKTVGAEYLAVILDEVSSPAKINWRSLPTNFVCKTNHGSGGMIGVWTGVEKEAKLPEPHTELGWTRWWVHPDNFQPEVGESMMNYWLRRDYAFRKGCYPEWAYQSVKRRAYVEELLSNANGTIASPLFFYVFDGTTRAVRISARDMNSSRSHGFVDRDWNLLHVGIGEIDPKNLINPFPGRPENWNELLFVAESLANNMDFVRVDLYNIDGRIVFSEMTNYPSAGTAPWVPADFDLLMGQYWNLACES